MFSYQSILLTVLLSDVLQHEDLCKIIFSTHIFAHG